MGTTIAEVGSGTISLAQLAQIISQIQAQQTNTGGGNIGTGDEGVLIVGPGLAGGGPLIGKVPLRLTAPIPWFDDAGGGGDGDPGPPGGPGPQGVAGVPGSAGAPGAAGATGTTLVYANTTVPAGNTVSNTSSETFFTSSYTVLANTLAIGTVLRIKLFGVYSTGVVAPSLALKIYFGATVLIASGTLTTVAGVTNDGWSAEGVFTVQTIGVAGTIEAQGLSEFSTASTAVLFVNMDNTAPITADTTINETVRASIQWGGTVNASDTITLREMTVEIMSITGIPPIAPPTPFYVFFGDDGDEGGIGMPGPAGPAGAGSATPFNVTPDTHLALPTGVGLGPNDEFDGAALDTGGTRYAGATAWTWFNQGSATASLSSGSLVLINGGGSSIQNGIGQPAPAAPWTYAINMQGVQLAGSAIAIGFMVRDTANNKQAQFGLLLNGGTISTFWGALSGDTFTATTTVASWLSGTDVLLAQSVPAWFTLNFAASVFTVAMSRSGVSGTFNTVFTVSLAASGLTTVNTIGLSIISGSANAALICDWFRRLV